jgi:hypothetical protein
MSSNAIIANHAYLRNLNAKESTKASQPRWALEALEALELRMQAAQLVSLPGSIDEFLLNATGPRQRFPAFLPGFADEPQIAGGGFRFPGFTNTG